MALFTEEMQQLQTEIQEKRERFVQLQLAQTPEEINDYELTNQKGEKVSLFSLFDKRNELLVIHNMGKSCPYCTMWADGLRGYTEIIADRLPWVLTSPNDFETMKNFAENRNWNFPLLSYKGTSFAKDLGFATEKDGKTYFSPGVSALIKKDGKIYRTAKDFFGPGDFYNPAFHFFNLFPNGINNWTPKYKY